MTRATPPASSAVSPPAATARAGVLLPAALVAAYYGAYIAVMSPATVSMALRVRQVVDEGQRVSTLSTVLSVGAFAAAIASPLLGALSDRTTLRFGKRRTWLVIGPLVGLAGLACIGLGGAVWLLVVGWVLAQAGWSGTLMAAQAVLTERIEPGMRGRVSGLMGPAMPVGMVAATLLVSLLDSSPALMLLVPGLIGVAGAALLVAVVPDAPADKTALPPFGPREFFSSFYVNPRRYPAYAWAFASRFLMFSGVFIILTYQTYIVSDRIGYGGDSTAGKVFQSTLLLGAGSIAASLLFGILDDRTGRLKPWLRLAAVASAAGLLVMSVDSSFGTFLTGMVLIGVAQGGYLSVDLPMVSRVLPDPEHAAQELGVYNLALVIPQMLIPLYGSLIVGADDNYPPLFVVGAACSALAMATLAGVRGVR
ncbi:MFS transporter [Streptomyces sp. NPDC002328]|uniref:MFS transporter n=1 Tax=Streptomyces sp. NPDC002328 TaxID=3364642 RepID=UPI0036C4D740